MTSKLTIDSAGRLQIPKSLREELHLGPGDTLHLESDSDRITLRPIRPQALLKREKGVWVYQGESTDTSIPDLIDKNREQRLRDLAR